jgi:hypothetical protein
MEESKKLFSLNFNSLLMFILLGVLGWLGMETRATSLSLIEVKTVQNISNKATGEALSRLEGTMNNSVSRREFEGRVLAAEAQLAQISVKLREIDLALVKLQKN